MSVKVIVFSILLTLCAAEIPSDIKKCKTEDSSCIASAATNLLAGSAKGRDDLGIPPYDPYTVPAILIDHVSTSRSVKLNLDLKDIVLHGLSQFKFNKAVGFAKDPTTSKFELYGELPLLKVEGRYKTQGKVLQLAIEGQGPFSISAEQSKIGIKFKPHIVERDGKRYLQIDKLKVKVQPSGVKIHIGNLFEGNEELTKQINQALNENWKDAWNEFQPNVIGVAEGVMKDIAQKMFDKISYDEMYLPD